jgi:hypothetical protein
VLCTRLCSRIDTTWNRRGAVVVEIVVQRAVTGTVELLLKEQRIIEEGQAVKDVEVGLKRV